MYAHEQYPTKKTNFSPCKRSKDRISQIPNLPVINVNLLVFYHSNSQAPRQGTELVREHRYLKMVQISLG